MENELLEFDRLNMIRDTINKYGANNFYISFSGGKDSTILSYLVDLALPNNTIPRVFMNTGMEYVEIVKFVKEMQAKDSRVVIVSPHLAIKPMLEKYGYPFKGKEHSQRVAVFQHAGKTKSVNEYIGETDKQSFQCPKILRYQFTNKCQLKISDKCCHKLKKQPFKKWQKENGKSICITGMRGEEGGRRTHLTCAIFDKDNNLEKFHPLVPVSKEFEEYIIKKYDIKLCSLYYPPYNFKRTGCKGCPFSLDLQKSLDKLHEFALSEEKICEIIWKPVYDEYRRLGYRLKKVGTNRQTTIYD